MHFDESSGATEDLKDREAPDANPFKSIGKTAIQGRRLTPAGRIPFESQLSYTVLHAFCAVLHAPYTVIHVSCARKTAGGRVYDTVLRP